MPVRWEGGTATTCWTVTTGAMDSGAVCEPNTNVDKADVGEKANPSTEEKKPEQSVEAEAVAITPKENHAPHRIRAPHQRARPPSIRDKAQHGIEDFEALNARWGFVMELAVSI